MRQKIFWNFNKFIEGNIFRNFDFIKKKIDFRLNLDEENKKYTSKNSRS